MEVDVDVEVKESDLSRLAFVSNTTLRSFPVPNLSIAKLSG